MSNDATSNVEPTITANIEPINAASLPMWQRTYLGALSAGLSAEDSRKHARVSNGTVERYLDQSPAFARAWTATVQGVSIIGAEELRSRAQNYGAVVLDDAFSESRSSDLAPQDRLGNRRLVLGAALPTQGGAVQVNVLNQASSNAPAPRRGKRG